jgi:hypothetical protein
MEKHELLSILYSERQRLAAKYTSPGWNYWVLLGALMSCVLYFLDLNPLKNFVWENVTTATGFLIIVLVIPSVFYLLYRKKDKEFYDGVLAKVSKPDRRYIKWIAFFSTVLFLVLYFLLFEYILPDILNLKYPVILIIALVLIYIVCFYGYIFNIFYKLEINLYISVILGFCFYTILKVFYLLCARNFTGLEFKFAIIIISFFSILYLLSTMGKSDLSSIDKLIDNTIDAVVVNEESTLKLLRVITIDYSVNSIFEDKIKLLISKNSIIQSNAYQIEELHNKLGNFNPQSEEAKELRSQIIDISADTISIIKEFKVAFSLLSLSLRKVPLYVRGNIYKRQQALSMLGYINEIAGVTTALSARIMKNNEKLMNIVKSMS